MKFMGRVAIGFCVCTFVTCVVAGGVEEGFEVLFLSIVCTAGIGLVVWGSLWWVVGWVVLAIVGLFMNKVEVEPIDLPARAVGGKNRHRNRALIKYIRQAMAAGMDPDVMTRRLQANGWDPAEIQNARQRIISSTSAAAGPSPA